MSKTLVIGASGLLGSRIVEALGEENCIRASRNSGERVDISDPKSLAALFARVGELDGIVCAGGAARFKPWDQLTDDDWTLSLMNKLMGQVNVVRYGAKNVRPGGAITLTTGVAAQYPSPGGAILTTVNAGGRGFRARRGGGAPSRCGSMRSRPAGSPRRSPRWAAIRGWVFPPPRSLRSLSGSFATALPARSRRRCEGRTFGLSTDARQPQSATALAGGRRQ